MLAADAATMGWPAPAEITSKTAAPKSTARPRVVNCGERVSPPARTVAALGGGSVNR
ncbi:MAG: hypothetical protein ACI9U2_003834 [Bradymonadia bacterium]|jgi:hypothetical protein